VRVLCVGGAIVDRKLRLLARHVPGTSNPVVASISPGGVARNIAENLWRDGVDVDLLSRVADDHGGHLLRSSLPIARSIETVVDGVTATYDAVLQPDGELVTGLVDSAILDGMDATWIRRHTDAIAAADWVLIDGNLPAGGIAAVMEIAASSHRRVALIPVSVPKIDRLPLETRVDLIVCNHDEALALDVRSVTADILVVTNGAEPTVLRWVEQLVTIAPPAVVAHDIVDVTGAGDAMAAGVIASLANGEDPSNAVRAGHRRAAAALLTLETVPRDQQR
jgi:pseudouridine kinase